jgi:cohesin complex subunit SA-1/2
VVQNFSELIDAKTLIARGVASFEELVALSNNLLRTVRLSSVSDCVVPLEDRDMINFESVQDDLKAPIDCILALIQRAIPDEETSIEPDEAAMEDQIAVRAADAALFYFRWKLKSFTDRLTANPPTDVPYEELEALAGRRDRYAGFLNEALKARKANEDVCAALVGYLLDMYTSAATLKSIPVREGMSDDFTVLIMEFDRETEKTLLKIFSASETKYARLSGKRLEDAPLASADADGDLDIDADPIDDDPVSEPESDDEDEQPTQNQSQSQAHASQKRKESKQLATLLAEQRLCELTGKIVTAVLGGIMSPARARPRLERNKEVCAYFDIEDVQAKKGGRKGAAAKPRNAAPKSKSVGKPSAKSNAIVAEDEEDDEIEDPEEDDPDVLKRRGLVVEEDVDDEEADAGNGAAAEEHADEMESVLGD